MAEIDLLIIIPAILLVSQLKIIVQARLIIADNLFKTHIFRLIASALKCKASLPQITVKI